MKNEKQKDLVVDIENIVVGEQEAPKIDVTEYIGKDITLAQPVTKQGEYGYYVDVESQEVLGTIETKDGELELKAKRRFGLKLNDEGKVYWTENMALGKFLNSKGLKHYNDMKGLKVKVQTRADDNGQEWLTF